MFKVLVIFAFIASIKQLLIIGDAVLNYGRHIMAMCPMKYSEEWLKNKFEDRYIVMTEYIFHMRLLKLIPGPLPCQSRRLIKYFFHVLGFSFA